MAGVAPSLVEQCILSFSANKLPSLDTFSKSDPMLVLYTLDAQKKATRVARTEYIMNNEDPKWSKTYKTDFFFEREQRFRLEVYDIDGVDGGQLNVDVSGFDFIGQAEFLLSQVMSGFNCTHSIQLTDKKGQPVHQGGVLSSKNQNNRSMIHIRGDQLAKTRHKLYFDVAGANLSKGSFFGKDDTEFQIVTKRPDGTEFSCFSTPLVAENQNPQWGGGKIDLGQLVEGGDVASTQQFFLRAVRVKGGKREIIGQVTAKLSDIKQGTTTTQSMALLDAKGKDRGTLIIKKWQIEEEFTFLDYMQGLDFHLTIAIDFTGSNKDPRQPDSLHYIHPGCRNQYIDSIRSIGSILTHYCKKTMVPVVGFGGFVSINGSQPDTSHCFPLSLDTNRPFCDGVEGVVQQYCESLPRITLSGPTFFEHVIKSCTQNALRPYTADYQHYNILLIITDGVINDWAKTVDSIIDASRTPLSIIVVGVSMVGPNGVSLTDFSAMEKLDGDEVRLSSPTKGVCPRDIVQFVPFMNYMNNPVELAHQTLAEVPTQVTEFMNLHRIAPIARKAPTALDANGNPAPFQDGGSQQY